MATIPQRYQSRQSPSPGAAASNYPGPQRSTGADLSSLQSELNQWAQRSLEQGEREAKKSAREQATQQQSEAGAGEITSPDEEWAPRFQDAFREQAIEFHSQQLELDAQREVSRLAREHQNDPEAFRSAASSYAEGVKQELEETDPTYAEQAQQVVAGMAEDAALKLEDRQFSRKQAARAQETLNTLDQFNADLQQELLNNPDEERYHEAMDSVEQRVDRAQQAGLITASQAEKYKDQQRRSMTREYVRGEFRKDIEAGDFDGAQSIIESLQQGKWFEDNERDRQLASQLSQGFESAREGAEGPSASFSLTRLNQIEDGALEKGGFDQEEANQHLKRVQRIGTANQVARALERYNGAYMASELRPQVDSMNLGELESAQDSLAERRANGNLSASAFNTLNKQLEDRQERVRTLASEGRFAELGGKIDWSQSPEQIAQTAMERPRRAARILADPSEDQDAFQERVEDVASNMPLFTPAELNKGVDQYRQARDNGDHERAAGIIEAMTAAYQGNPMRMAGELARAGEVSGELYTAGVLGQMGQAEGADRLLYYADQGRSVQQDEGERQRLEREVLEGDVDRLLNEKFSGAIRSASMGEAELRSGMRSFLRDSLYGLAAEQGEDGNVNAEEAIESWIGPLAESTEFANGKSLPAAFLPREQREALTGAVNERLENAGRSVSKGGLGIDDATDREAIQPAPLGNGKIGYRLRGRWLMNDEGTAPVQVAPPADEGEDEGTTSREFSGRPTGSRFQEDETGGFKEAFDSAASAVEDVVDWQTHGAKVSQAQVAAEHYGVDREPMGAIVKTVQDLSEADPSKLHGREGIMGLSADADDRVDWDRVTEAAEQSIGTTGTFERTVQNADVATYAAADLMRQAREAFPDDRRAQFVAYYEGPEVVEAAREKAGEQWFTALPHDTQAMVRRTERYADGG